MSSALDIRLRVDGTDYLDIKSARMTRSIDQLADTVTIEFSDKWMTRGSKRSLPFGPLDSAEFIIDGEPVISGYIAKMPRSWAKARSFSLTLMSQAGHMVLSEYVAKPRHWKEQDVKRIVTDLCKPYGIEVTTILRDFGEPFDSFAVRPGEKAAGVITRALEARGLWLMSRPSGYMELVEAGQARYALPFIGPGHPTLASNVLDFSADNDSDMLFSEYIVSGSSQRLPTLDDDTNGVHVVKDPSVEVYRPKLIMDGSQGKAKHLGYRAKREMAVRAARAREFTIAVEGAYWDRGAVAELLEPNRRAMVDLPDDDIDGEFLITTASTKMANGTITSLICTPPEAYMRKSPPPKPRRRGSRKDGKAASWT